MKLQSAHRIFLCASFAAMWLPGLVASAAEKRPIGPDDYWHYFGDVEYVDHVHGPTCVVEGTRRACAHGYGKVGTDGLEFYTGMWAYGFPDGFGTYENDALEYVGYFSEDHFQGKGVITCSENDRRIEGTFVDGKLVGQPESKSYGSRIMLQIYDPCP
jgi:hypothetical protein